jgi:ABC-type antimicrobial peptide transport system permease subunit
MKTSDPTPPRWVGRILAWYCKPELLEDLQGDLNEYFDRNVKKSGARRAKLIYVIDVLRFCRIYTVRKPKFVEFLIHWIMIGSYIKTSGRNIVRNKLFSGINIIGMAISMSVGLLMISFISDLLSYDSFHEKKDRIYRVNSDYKHKTWASRFASTSVLAGKKIKDEITGVEHITILRSEFRGDAEHGDVTLPISGLWADENLFKVFSFPLVNGNAATALKEPFSIVLTETSAKKLFGDADAIGQVIKFDTVSYTVSGVMKDITKFSHIQTEALVSFSSAEALMRSDKHFLAWNSIWQNYVYITLPEGTPEDLINHLLIELSAENKNSDELENITLYLQPLSDIVLGEDLSNTIGGSMPGMVFWIAGGLAALVIISACFNYANLSIARSLRRTREVGIRKVVGAQRSHVTSQFLAEAIIISLFALVLAVGIFFLLRSVLASIAPEINNIVSLEISVQVLTSFVILAIVVGLLAGIFPAIFFARIHAASALKDAGSLKLFGRVNMRKGLIVLQYTLSLIFVLTTVIGYHQYKNFLTFDLGYNTESILNIRLTDIKASRYIKALNEMPEVTGISRSHMVTSVGTMFAGPVKYNNFQDSSYAFYNAVDEHYIPMHGHTILTGRNFTPKKPGDTQSEIMVTETFIKKFNIGDGDPEKAIGQPVNFDRKDLTVIAVLKDFHYGTAREKIEPVALIYLLNETGGFLNASIKTDNWPATLQKMDAAWRNVDKVHPFDAQFYDEKIENAYSEYSAMLQLLGFLGFLALVISSMGMLGMVVFTTETKLKELSIRKVLGASVASLMLLVSRSFLIMLGIASAIAIPVTYMFFTEIVLAEVTFPAPITPLQILPGIGIVVGIALIMLVSQTLTAARSNPAEVLKNE